jgi:peptidoglycan hydrolase-like protein with peptidoglycan-binding domain
MFRRIVVPLLQLLMLVGPAFGLAYPVSADEVPRIALVIGNAHYQHVPILRNPTNDAQLIAGTLRDLGFKLVGGGARLDLDRTSLELAIRDFSHQLIPGAIAFFYYSGHGIQVHGNNYLVPTGADPTSDRDVDFDMVDVSLLLHQLEESGTSLNVLVLDACRNNPFGGRGLRDIATGLAQMQAPRGTIIAYATQPGGVAADGDGADSPYTTALAATMQRPGLGIIDMFNDVAVAVDRATNHVQQPWTALSPITQPFYLIAKSADAGPQSSLATGTSPPAAQPSAVGPNSADREVVFWESVQNRGSVVELRAYLQRYPNGLFADLARTRIAELESAAHSQTAPADRSAPTPPTEQQLAAAKPATPALAPPADIVGPSQVADAQRLLSAIGFGVGRPDGVLGPRTRDAIRAFQLAVGMPPEVGISEALLSRLRGPSPSRQALVAALIKLAEDATHTGKTLDAVRLYTEVTEFDPANGESLIALGDLQKSLGNIGDARHSYLRAQSGGGTIGEKARQRLASLPVKPDLPTLGNHTTTGEIKATLTPSTQGSPRATVPPTVSNRGSPTSVWVVTASGYFMGMSELTFAAMDADREVARSKAVDACKAKLTKWANSCSVVSERRQSNAGASP